MGRIVFKYLFALALFVSGLPLVLQAQTQSDRPQARPDRATTVAAKTLFGAAEIGSGHAAESFGSYAKGCLAGGAALPETGPTWQAMRLSRNRNWGQPITIDFLQELSQKVAQSTSWSGLYIGDISQPRGGPMLSGHESHQIGLDADIWLRPKTDRVLTQAEREEISSISMRRA